MHKRVRALIDQAQAMGFTVDGNDGRGHIRLTHSSGEPYRLASTPGDYRGDRNALADMRRIAGIANDGPAHRRSRKAFHVSGYTSRKSARELSTSAQVDALTRRWTGLVARFEAIQAAPTWTEALRIEALAVIAGLQCAEEELINLHQPLPRADIAATWRIEGNTK